MAVPIPVPRFGLAVTGSRVAEWYQPDGATVATGDPICCLETGEVAVEIEAESDGILRHQIPAGAECPPGDVLGVILLPDEHAPGIAAVDNLESLADPVDTSAIPAGPSFESDGGAPGFPYPGEATPDDAEHAATGEPLEPPGETPPPLVFPRRFASLESDHEWDTVPGDKADFETALWPGGGPADSVIETLAEPGGAIPDLPIWEEPENAPFAEAPLELPVRPAPALLPTARAAATPLVLRATVTLTEASKMLQQLGREWRSGGLVPSLEDIVVRAAARAWQDIAETDPAVALRRVADGSEDVTVLTAAATRSFRDAVKTLAGAHAADGSPDFIVTTFHGSGVDDATPRLDAANLALTMSDERSAVALLGDTPVQVQLMTLSVAYAPNAVADGTAAAFMGRLRDLVEAPYALLAD